jgi:hypothetical protein
MLAGLLGGLRRRVELLEQITSMSRLIAFIAMSDVVLLEPLSVLVAARVAHSSPVLA